MRMSGKTIGFALGTLAFTILNLICEIGMANSQQEDMEKTINDSFENQRKERREKK